MKNKHAIALLIFLALGVAQCSQPKEKKLVNIGPDWIAALNRQDMTQILSFYADSVQSESPNWEGIKTGKRGVQEVYSRYFSSSPNIRYQLTNSIIADSAIVIEYLTTAILSNPEKGSPSYMLGKPYTLKNITRFDMKNGKIIRQASYFDQVSFLRQMGFFEQK